MWKYRKSYKKYYSKNYNMNQREFDKFMKWLLRMIWLILKWSVLLVFFLVWYLWKKWDDFAMFWRKKIWNLLKLLSVLPVLVLWIGWYFIYDNWKIILIKWLPATMCIYEPWACAKDTIKEEMIKDIIQKASNNQSTPIQITNQK